MSVRSSIGLLVGLLGVIGVGVAISPRLRSSELEECGAQVMVGEVQPLTPEALTQLTTGAPQGGRQEFIEAGLTIQTEKGQQIRLVEAGVNRIVFVPGEGGQTLFSANSAPFYPWMDHEGMKAALRGTWTWKKGPVELPELQIKLDWPGEWGYQATPPQLALTAEGRITVVTGQWEDPAFRRLLSTLQPMKGGDYRSTYLRIKRAPEGSGGSPPSAALVEDVDKSVRLVEAGAKPDSPFSPVVLAGIAAWKGKKLDHLDGMIFLDILRPVLRDLERAAMEKMMQEQTGECPVPGIGPSGKQEQGQETQGPR